MPGPRWLAILNPAAGRGTAQRAWPRLASALARAGVACDLEVTRGPGEAARHAERAARAGTDRLLAVGGDGTLHEVVNGAMASGRRCRLAVAPFGTGNDWARGLRVPRQPAALAALLARDVPTAHDVGAIEYATAAGRARAWFINVAGVGYDGWVLEHLPRAGPRALAYAVALARGLRAYRPPIFLLRAGEAECRERLFVAFACLGRYCGGGMRFAPQADGADGLLDVVTVRHMGALAALRRVPRLYTGRILADPAVRLLRAPTLEIDTDAPAAVQADGQLLGRAPVRIRLHARAVDVIAPPAAPARR